MSTTSSRCYIHFWLPSALQRFSIVPIQTLPGFGSLEPTHGVHKTVYLVFWSGFTGFIVAYFIQIFTSYGWVFPVHRKNLLQRLLKITSVWVRVLSSHYLVSIRPTIVLKQLKFYPLYFHEQFYPATQIFVQIWVFPDRSSVTIFAVSPIGAYLRFQTNSGNFLFPFCLKLRATDSHGTDNCFWGNLS